MLHIIHIRTGQCHPLCTYSCKLPRSTRVAPSLFLRARSSLSSLLFDFSASRSSLVRLFTAGIKLHTRWWDTSHFISPCFFKLANFIELGTQKKKTYLSSEVSLTPSTIALSTKADKQSATGFDKLAEDRPTLCRRTSWRWAPEWRKHWKL